MGTHDFDDSGHSFRHVILIRFMNGLIPRPRGPHSMSCRFTLPQLKAMLI